MQIDKIGSFESGFRLPDDGARFRHIYSGVDLGPDRGRYAHYGKSCTQNDEGAAGCSADGADRRTDKGDQAVATARRRRVRRAPPRPPTPISIMAQVAGSGVPLRGTGPLNPVAVTPSTQ